jgi:hypothetical protein
MRVARHGTNSKYHTGCRCEDCTEAHRDYSLYEYHRRTQRRSSAGRPLLRLPVSSESPVHVERMMALIEKLA